MFDGLEYIVSGTGRCGTKYMSRVLTACGIICGHEKVFSFRGIIQYNKMMEIIKNKFNIKQYHEEYPEKLLADSSFLTVPFLDELSCKVIHLIRHPCDFVRSTICRPLDEEDTFLINHFFLPEIYNYENNIDRSFYYWFAWNKMVTKKDFLQKIEDPLDGLFSFLKKSPVVVKREKSLTTGDLITVDMIKNQDLKKNVIELAKLYDYKINSNRYFI